MLVQYLQRGVVAGAVAGLVFGLLLALVANPLVAVADELGHGEAGHEASHTEATENSHEGTSSESHESAVSLATTKSVSVLSGVLWGVLLGGVVFGFAYYLLEPVIPGTGATKSLLLGAGGFLSVSGAPWLVLPPQPPGIEQAIPTETRLLLYGGMMVAGTVLCLLSAVAYGRFEDTHGRVTATVVALLPFSLLAIPAVLVPTSTAAGALPAGLATGLSGLVVFGQVALWLTLAGVHASLGTSGDRRQGETTDYADATVAAD